MRVGTFRARAAGVPSSTLSTLWHGPLSAVRGAMDTVKYAQAFVSHAPRDQAGLRADDDERDLILEEELGTSEARVVPELPADRA
jgi:hypothetical protein